MHTDLCANKQRPRDRKIVPQLQWRLHNKHKSYDSNGQKMNKYMQLDKTKKYHPCPHRVSVCVCVCACTGGCVEHNLLDELLTPMGLKSRLEQKVQNWIFFTHKQNSTARLPLTKPMEFYLWAKSKLWSISLSHNQHLESLNQVF